MRKMVRRNAKKLITRPIMTVTSPNSTHIALTYTKMRFDNFFDHTYHPSWSKSVLYRLFCSTNTSARYYVEKTGEKTPYRGKTTQASAQPWQSGTLICSCQSSYALVAYWDQVITCLTEFLQIQYSSWSPSWQISFCRQNFALAIITQF